MLGRLRDDRGAPLAAPRIVAHLDGTTDTRDEPESPSCTTGADGQFALRGLAAGKWRLTLVPLNIAREIELAPADSRIERFVLGDPAQLILEVRDRKSVV